MSTSPHLDLATALRAELPPRYHALIDPLVRTIEAFSDPAAKVALSQALAALGGRDVLLSSGASINFAGASAGDVTIRDTAGGDIVHLTLTLGSEAPAEPALDDDQVRLLRALAQLPGQSNDINFDTFAATVELSVPDLEEELDELSRRALLRVDSYGGGVIVEVTRKGRKLLSRLDQQEVSALLQNHNLDRELATLLVTIGSFQSERVDVDRLAERVSLAGDVLNRRLLLLHEQRLIKAFEGSGQVVVLLLLAAGAELVDKLRGKLT